MKKKVLITGVNGFTGRYLAFEMSQAGYEVHGLIHKSIADFIPGVSKLHVADLSDMAGLSKIVKDIQPEKVVHLAAISFVAHGDTDAIYQTNVLGSRNLLEALVQQKNSIENIMLASSANVYGNAMEGILDECTPASPSNDYAISKLTMEYVARLYAERLPLTIVRPFNYTGVGQSKNFLIPKIVSHVRRGASLINLGNLEIARDFSDVRTVVKCYLRLLQADTTAVVGKTFNVCSGCAWTLNQILDMVREISGHTFEVQVNPEFVRHNEIKLLIGSNAKLSLAIGELPAIRLEDTLRWMLEED